MAVDEPQRPTGRVNEQDLHMKVGAYDEVYHPHGYVHEKERHQWYWFAGLGALGLGVVATLALYWHYDRGLAPVCARVVTQSATSGDGALVAEVAQVSCFGGTPSLRIILRPAQSGAGGPAIASFSDNAALSVSWGSDGQLIVAKGAGRVWFSKSRWKSVTVRYVMM